MNKHTIHISFGLILLIFGFSSMLTGTEMKGKIKYLNNKYQTILVEEEGTGNTEIFEFNKRATPPLHPNDEVMVTYASGNSGKGIVVSEAVEKLYVNGAISPDQFEKAQSSGAVIVDVRSEKRIKKGIITGAVHIPLNELENKLQTLPKSKQIVFYSSSGAGAAIAYNILKNNGYPKAGYLSASVMFRKGKLYIR